MFASALKMIFRKIKPVQFDDPLRVVPISRQFGCERGLPIDRYYIEKFLDDNSCYIKGRVLEVGGREYGEKFGDSNLIRHDILHVTDELKGDSVIVGNLAKLETLPMSAYDCFICTQTLNFIYEFQNALAGARYLLAPGGTLLLTVAGLCQISQYDMERWGDYWRFTSKSLQVAMEQSFPGAVTIKTYGNVMAAVSLLQGVCVADLPNQMLLDHFDENYQVIVTAVVQRNAE